MGIGLTFEEYAELRLKPRAGADRAFHRAADEQREEMFPMKTGEASHHLRSRGYDCKPAMLELLVRNGVVTLAEPEHWTQKPRESASASIMRPKALLLHSELRQVLNRLSFATHTRHWLTNPRSNASK